MPLEAASTLLKHLVSRLTLFSQVHGIEALDEIDELTSFCVDMAVEVKKDKKKGKGKNKKQEDADSDGELPSFATIFVTNPCFCLQRTCLP